MVFEMPFQRVPAGRPSALVAAGLNRTSVMSSAHPCVLSAPPGSRPAPPHNVCSVVMMDEERFLLVGQ